MNLAVFPGGQRQIDTESDQLAARLNRRFSPEQTKEILIHAKARAFVAFQTGSRSEDSAQTCIESIRARSQGALDEATASEVYIFVVERLIDGARQSGHVAGETAVLSAAQIRNPDELVEVEAKTSREGIGFEYAWLERRFGVRDKDWAIVARTHGHAEDGKAYEIFTIKTGPRYAAGHCVRDIVVL